MKNENVKNLDKLEKIAERYSLLKPITQKEIAWLIGQTRQGLLNRIYEECNLVKIA